MPDSVGRIGPEVGEGGGAPEETPFPATNGVLSVRVADDFVLDGGRWELGRKRMSSGAEKAIIRQAQDGLHTGLKTVDMLKYGGEWPPSAERVLPFLHPLVGPARWSYTEQSRAVELCLRCGAQQHPQPD